MLPILDIQVAMATLRQWCRFPSRCLVDGGMEDMGDMGIMVAMSITKAARLSPGKIVPVLPVQGG